MKMKSASNYDRKALVENIFGILFAVALTALLILNLDSLVEISKSFNFVK